MRVGIVGGGILGLSLAHCLQRGGHQTDIFERNSYLGGLASAFDYGDFIWDRFYHVILPQDAMLIELLGELGLASAFRWRRTRTGYYCGGRCYAMSSSGDMLRFPMLGWLDKLRMGMGTVRAVRFANRQDLYRQTAAEWLPRVFGQSNYDTFWRPLLRAKFGPYAEEVAAISIQTALARLFGARSAVARREAMGYVHGGYHRIVAAFRRTLEGAGANIHLGARIRWIGSNADLAANDAVRSTHARVAQTCGSSQTGGVAAATSNANGSCAIERSVESGCSELQWYDKVVFTAPLGAALPIVSPRIRRVLESSLNGQLMPSRYLGVVCLTLVLRRPVTRFYVLNIADPGIPLTGVIEMTGLIDPAEETRGRSLVYLPRYVDCQDPLLGTDDRVVYDELFDRGLRKLFPDLRANDVVSWHVQRAPHVQPLRLATHDVPPPGNRPALTCDGFVLANTALLACPTLHNNEVVGLAREIACSL